MSRRVWFTIVGAGILFAALWALVHRDSVLSIALGEREWSFLAPRWLLALSLLPGVWLGRALTLTDFPPVQTAIGALVRSLLVGSLIIAIARPAVTTRSDRVSVVAAIDISNSMADDQVEAAIAFLEQARPSIGRNQLQVVGFDEHARKVELSELAKVRPKASASLKPTRAHPGDTTDIAAALQLGESLFASDAVARFVLLSDGRETKGNALAQVLRAKESGIRVDVASLPPRSSLEVVLRSLTAPSGVTLGRPFELAAEIISSHAVSAKVDIDQGELPNPLEPRRHIDLQPGRNVVRLKSLLRHGGQIRYSARVEVEGTDALQENNRQTMVLAVEGRPRVLMCDGEPDRAFLFAKALRAEQIDVDIRGPQGVPTRLAELEAYDLLVLSDVEAAFLGPQQLTAIETFVRDLGGGLLFAAGAATVREQISGSELEQLLPVRFDSQDRRDEPTLALVLTIDKSGSMAGHKIELAKEAARATAELLSATDLLGVIAFDSQPTLVVRLQRAAARQRIAADIAKIAASGGTGIFPALQESFAQLLPARAKVKHVILLSDGQSAYQGISDLVDQMVQSKITVSTVGIGDGADRTLLASIAERSGGRFYLTQDAANVPRIFMKETTEVARSALVEDRVAAIPVKRAQMLQGIDFSSAPSLLGYVATQPKRMGEVLLASQYGEPLLARWNVGIGRATVWTSDLKARWSAAWLNWNRFSQFWAQVVRQTMRAGPAQRFDLQVEMIDQVAHVEVDALDKDGRFLNGLQGKVTILNAEKPNERVDAMLRQSAPGRYSTEVQVPFRGAAFVRATLSRDDEAVGTATGTVSSSYPMEYSDLTTNTKLLEELARRSGGRVGVQPRDLFDAEGESVTLERELWPWAIGLGVFLLLLDVMLRRIRWFRRQTVST